VTEEVTGIDIVQTQIQIAEGASISDLGIRNSSTQPPVGFAIQTRVNMETLTSAGNVRPSNGELEVYEPPMGTGVRIDGCGYTTYTTNTSFDSLLAKLIVHSDSDQFSNVIKKSLHALSAFRIEGILTNISFLRNVLLHEDFYNGRIHTTWVDENMASLADSSNNS
jgi:pyruvate carboxylase